MTRLKVHHMAEGGALQATIAARTDISIRSVERILAETAPTVEEVVEGVRSDAKRLGRPPKADDALVERVRALLAEDGDMMATEVLRRAREWGYTGGKSAMSELVKKLRPIPTKEPIVRFEGMAGEYAQFDFGEVTVTYAGGTKEKLIFFAGRLKYSRYMHVVLVLDQTAETVVRSVIACLEAFGGSPKEWVFDNPKTIRISPIGVEPPVLHAHLRELVASYRVIPTLCAPRSGNQKGSVERLVGYAKKSFFLARRFRDRAAVEAQLLEWLHEVNDVRGSDATGVIPALAKKDEDEWLAKRPVQDSAHEHPIRVSATVTPMGTISFEGTPYFATAKRIGAPATLLVRRHSIDILVGEERCAHRRVDGAGVVQRLPSQRQEMLAAIHGKRKIATYRRQCLLELGQPAWAFMSVLVHVCPDGRWEEPCAELYALLDKHGAEELCDAFTKCVLQKRFTVDAVRAAIRKVA